MGLGDATNIEAFIEMAGVRKTLKPIVLEYIKAMPECQSWPDMMLKVCKDKRLKTLRERLTVMQIMEEAHMVMSCACNEKHRDQGKEAERLELEGLAILNTSESHEWRNALFPTLGGKRKSTIIDAVEARAKDAGWSDFTAMISQWHIINRIEEAHEASLRPPIPDELVALFSGLQQAAERAGMSMSVHAVGGTSDGSTPPPESSPKHEAPMAGVTMRVPLADDGDEQGKKKKRK